jgi:ABC-2 type transport system permease protein
MRTIWLVVKHDALATLRQRSFWVLALLMPALLLGLNIYATIQDNREPDYDPSQSAETTQAPTDLPPIGLVDEAGLLAEMPADFPSNLFKPYADEATARAALEAGTVEQYVHVPADVLVNGEITVYDRNFQILQSGEDMGVAFHSNNAWVLEYLVNYNLTGDQQLVATLQNPVPSTLAKPHALRPPAEGDEDNQALAEVVSSLVPYVYYFLLLMGSSFLLRSVVAEKENRTAEVLLLSLKPRDLMAGKILAMTVVLVVQLVIWVGGGMLVLDRGADLLNVPDFAFPPGFVAWAILFLVLGYLLFASIMAAAGAIAPNAREGGQMTWLLVIPLMPTLMFGELLVNQPDHPLTLVLSLFPFSSPSAMVTRLAVGSVPLWQILVSVAALALTTYLFILLAGRFFRAGNLLSDASFSWRRVATGWRT